MCRRSANTTAGLTGQWVLALGKRNLLVLSLTPGSGCSSQPFTGSLSHPRHSQTSDGRSFSHIQGDSQTAPIISSAWKGSVLSLVVRDPNNPSDKDTLLFTLKDNNHAQLQYEGLPAPPFELVHAEGTPTVAADWDKTKTYSPDDDLPSNPEMKRIFDEDQRVRQPGVKIDWTTVDRSGAQRREAVMKLLGEGALHTGEDFTWAAFVFQHGSTPDDFLLAHTLALITLKKGNGDALWIATATLDRYLQAIHQPQIYGTQFLTPQNRAATQAPYNRTLISDALRRELGVPIQSAQEEQRKQYDVQRGITK